MLAEEVETSERTLRRAANRGTIRVVRKSPRWTLVPSDEYEYVRRRWPLVRALLRELRTLPAVRLAVLFGSVARGTESPESDLDILVRLRSDGVDERAHVAERLEAAAGRSVQIVQLGDAESAPSLLLAVLQDGRVLVDRDGDWPKLKRRESRIGCDARRSDRQIERDVGAALAELGVQ